MDHGQGVAAAAADLQDSVVVVLGELPNNSYRCCTVLLLKGTAAKPPYL